MQTLNDHLLIMACSAAKARVTCRADQMYKGVMWTTKRHAAVEVEPRILVFSARYGLMRAEQEISPYEEQMTEALSKSLTQAFSDPIRADRVLPDLLAGQPVRPTHVYVAGGELYRTPVLAAVNRWKDLDLIERAAPVVCSQGGIGEQRRQLRQYLERLQPADGAVVQQS